MTIVSVFVKIISIPDEEVFSETAPFHTLSKIRVYGVPVGFVNPPPTSFEAVYCFICGRQMVAVARYVSFLQVNFVKVFLWLAYDLNVLHKYFLNTLIFREIVFITNVILYKNDACCYK